MTYDDLIRYYGTPSKPCKVLGISRPLIHDWKRKGIPKLRQYEIEVKTGGALKAQESAA